MEKLRGVRIVARSSARDVGSTRFLFWKFTSQIGNQNLSTFLSQKLDIICDNCKAK